jgi:steroid delta-isomerase-like uncharacterized protein
MSAENKEVAKKFMENCWNRGDMSKIGELVSRDCRYHDPVFPSFTSGLEDLKQHISNCRGGFPDLRFTIDDMIAERHEVVLHWTAHGSHKGQFLGMAPTNKSATVTGTSIYKLEKDKIVEQWSDWNLLSLLEQLGLAKALKTEGEAKPIAR